MLRFLVGAGASSAVDVSLELAGRGDKSGGWASWSSLPDTGLGGVSSTGGSSCALVSALLQLGVGCLFGIMSVGRIRSVLQVQVRIGRRRKIKIDEQVRVVNKEAVIQSETVGKIVIEVRAKVKNKSSSVIL